MGAEKPEAQNKNPRVDSEEARGGGRVKSDYEEMAGIVKSGLVLGS